ncbi:oligoendopeptidase F [Mycoplasma sp. 480]|uniref:oligoendopeptidase F n=1 Tax=Mycoplasma sp. 480 TaxID=3440155 RepID=UPI003F50DBB7
MKNYKNYNEIPEKYKFDLEFILKNKSIQEWLDDFEKYSIPVIKTSKTKFENIDKFIEYKEKQKEFDLYFSQIYNYLSNKKNTNLVEPVVSTHFGLLLNKYSDFIKELGSEENEYFKNSHKINEWKSDPRFQLYNKDVEEILSKKEHKYVDEVENYITQTSKGEVSLYQTFAILRDSETKFDEIISKNKKFTLNQSTYFSYLKRKDENIRKQAYTNYLNGFLNHKQTFSSLLEQHIRNKSTDALNRNYNSLVEKEISNDKVPLELLNKLFSIVQSNSNLYDLFYKTKKQFFKQKYNKDYKPWDSMLPLVNIKEKYSVEDAQSLLFEAVKPLGETYLNKVKEAINQRWVDYLTVPNKRSGAYSIGSHYSLEKKYILMNFNGTLNSVATLAHEMGHSMHSWYSDQNQPYEHADYPIFLAEIASIFNELMLFDYMFTNAKNEKLKFHLLEKSIQDFLSTVVRQCQWANYEYELYKNIDNSVPMKTFESFEKIYVDVLNKYTNIKNKEKVGNKSNIYSVIVPHFYYNFYVYKYAIGYIVANIFFQKYKENGVQELENYINKFLSSGSKDWPLNILKDSNIDLLDNNTLQKVFDLLNNKIKLYKTLGKKIFK